ncbi:FAD-dependent oxidoreductase [Lacticaseibacillus sp. 53-4]|uniref:FAD-dependent oxidoreductase n=1 Tax=Lacticaseibacillus sp. 53-4 TaxID=2799575 RepID=UPI001945A96E|nr:FAD-dependent oxidoreductase [Lacticaseibacillus sp. 53-4]
MPEVVIIGGGLSGLVASITARQAGLSCVVIEKGRSLGGDGNYVEGAMGVDSKLQQQAGITIDRTQLLQDELNYSHFEASAPHLKQLIDHSGETIDWLADQGVKFASVGPQGKSWPTIHAFAGGGHAAVATLVAKARQLGVEFCTSTSAQKLLQTAGHLSGVEVMNEVTGQTKEIATDNVILATGGYVDNPELIKKQTPLSDRLMSVSDGKSTGDGMQLAWAAGAMHDSMGALQFGGGAIYDPMLPPFLHMSSEIGVAATQEAILWVNQVGDRFVNEDVNDNMCHAGNALLGQARTFAIFDAEAVKHLSTVGLYKAVGNSPFSPDTLSKLPDELASDLAAHRKYLAKADTLEALADQLHLPNLVDSVARYNRQVTAGVDADFGKASAYLTPVKDGPFYAVTLGVGMACAIGGLRIDTHNAVLNAQGYPLPGLYAIGNDAAGMLVGDTYAVTLPGSTAGFAAFSGRNAVAAIVQQK